MYTNPSARPIPNQAFNLKTLPRVVKDQDDKTELIGVLGAPDGPDGSEKVLYLMPRTDPKLSRLHPNYHSDKTLRKAQNAAAKLALEQIINRVRTSELLKYDDEAKSAITDLEGLLAFKAKPSASITVGDVKNAFNSLNKATERLEHAQRHKAINEQLAQMAVSQNAPVDQLVSAIWSDQKKLKDNGEPSSEFTSITFEFNNSVAAEADNQPVLMASASTPLTKEIRTAAKLQNEIESACKSNNLTEEEVAALGEKVIEANKKFMAASNAAINRNPLLASKYISLPGVAAAPVQLFTRAEMIFSSLAKQAQKNSPGLLKEAALEFLNVFPLQLEGLETAAATLRDPSYLKNISPDRWEIVAAMAQNCDNLSAAIKAQDSPFIALYHLCNAAVANPEETCAQLRQSMGLSDEQGALSDSKITFVTTDHSTDQSIKISDAQTAAGTTGSNPVQYIKRSKSSRDIPRSATEKLMQRRNSGAIREARTNVVRIVKSTTSAMGTQAGSHHRSERLDKGGQLIVSALQPQPLTEEPTDPNLKEV